VQADRAGAGNSEAKPPILLVSAGADHNVAQWISVRG
jgi:hypothetical protein